MLLNIFGANRMFAVAEKVRSAMDQDGTIKNPAALGIDTSLATEDSPKVKHWKAEIERLKRTPGMQVYVSTAEQMLEISKREQNGEHTGYFAHNCYEVFWTLLTKDDPKLTALCQIYRARLKGLGGADLGAFTYRTRTFPCNP